MKEGMYSVYLSRSFLVKKGVIGALFSNGYSTGHQINFEEFNSFNSIQ